MSRRHVSDPCMLSIHEGPYRSADRLGTVVDMISWLKVKRAYALLLVGVCVLVLPCYHH